MNYKLVLFKADEASDLAMAYSQNHAQVLAGYGCTSITSNREEWMDNPGAYAIVAFDEGGDMVSGIRLHLYNENFPLPVESAITELDGRIVDIVKKEAKNITGEACALWTAESVSGKGFGLIMTRAAIAVAGRLGATTLFGFASPFTYKMFCTLGYTRVPSVGRNGDFLYPSADYISTVIVIPDLEVLAHAEDENRVRMLDIREKPCQSAIEGGSHNLTVTYELDKCRTTAPVPAPVHAALAFA